MIEQLINYFVCKKRIREEKDEFNNLMAKARKLSTKVKLEDLIKIILRPIQSDHIRDAYIKPDHAAKGSLDWPKSLQIENNIPSLNKTILDCIFLDPPIIRVMDKNLYPKINLATDIVLPTCWSPASIEQTLGVIGPGLSCGEFKQNSNHTITYTYPLGISWVNNGNHSIAQGIIHGQGILTPSDVYDLTPLIDVIQYDGIYWRCLKTNKVLGKPFYKEFGWTWEIARLIIKYDTNPFGLDKV